MEKIERVNIVADHNKREVSIFALKLAEGFLHCGVEYTTHPSQAQLAIVLGGDGMMLEAVQKYWTYKVPILGLNFGHKGFMLNELKNLEDILEMVINYKLRLVKFPLLQAKMEAHESCMALSDIYFNRIGGQSCKINIKVNDRVLVERLTGDGFIVSTALGSTGYNFAAGGPALYPELPNIVLTPVCVHAPIQLRPTVFPLGTKVNISILNLCQSDIKGFYDGSTLPSADEIEITCGEYWQEIAFWEDEDFTSRLVNKMMKIQEDK
jgi:NAD+ kinase